MESGFTLMEVMLAMVILAMMMGLIYGTFFSALESKRIVETAQERYHRLRVFNKRLGEELAGAFISDAYRSKAGAQPPDVLRTEDMRYYFLGEDGGPYDRLSFTTNAGRPRARKAQGDLVQVSYYTEAEEGSELRTLYREEKPITMTEARPESGRTGALFRNVKRFDLAFVNRGTEKEYLDGWDSGSTLYDEQYMNPPRAVEVELVLSGDGGGERTFTFLLPTPNVFEAPEDCP